MPSGKYQALPPDSESPDSDRRVGPFQPAIPDARVPPPLHTDISYKGAAGYSASEYYGSAGDGGPHCAGSPTDSRKPALQTRYTLLAAPAVRGGLRHRYRKLKQIRKLAQTLALHWFMGLLLCGLVVGLFLYFENKGVLSIREKRVFNGLFIGATLMFGMNIVVSGGERVCWMEL